MKKLARSFVAAILGWQVRRLQKKNDFKIVAVAGSIGKTSTKVAIASVLKQKFKLRYNHGNLNDLVSVPLIYFGHEMPSLFNPIAWLKIFWDNERQLRQNYNYDLILIELGPDGPGQMDQFKSYVKADLGVLTAITEEHLELFGDLETVGREEMVIAKLCNKLFFNSDLVDQKFIAKTKTPVESYDHRQFQELGLKLPIVSDLQIYSFSAAIAVGREMGLRDEDIKRGLKEFKPYSGRMQLLEGINGSKIIDDSYNASPVAMKAALDTLYKTEAPRKISPDLKQCLHAELKKPNKLYSEWQRGERYLQSSDWR